MKLDKIFRGINEKMIIDFDYITSEINHNLSKGQTREREIINEYLNKYLPGNIGISNGEIVATNDTVSPETDIIFFEKNSTPYFVKKDQYQVFPIECVYGVIEVKSNLNKSKLKDSFEKIHKIKKMPKTAFEPQKGPITHGTNLYDKRWKYFPTIGMVIAFDSIDLKTLKDYYLELIQNQPKEHIIDSIWILKKGMIINQNSVTKQIELAPNNNSEFKIMKSDNPIMLLTVQLQSLLASAWMPFFQINDYLLKANFGNLNNID